MKTMINENIIGQAEFILQNIIFGVLIEDKDRKIFSANQAFIDIFNIPLSPSELVGLDCIKLAEDVKNLYLNQDDFLCFIDKCTLDKVKSEAKEFELTNGKIVEVNYIPYWKDNSFMGHSWCYNETTQIKKSLLENQNQKKFFETILHQIPADIAIFDAEHNYIFLNKQAVKDDVLRNWLLGKNDYDFCKYRNVNIDIAHERREMFNKLKATKQNVSWEDKRKNKDGKETLTLRIFHPYFDSNENLKYAIGYGIDLTEFKLKDLMLQEEEQKSLALIKELKEVIFGADINGRILNLNPAWVTLTGTSVEKSIDKNLLDFFAGPTDFKNDLNGFFINEARKEIKYITKIKVKRHFKWVEISIFKKTGLVTKDVYLWGTIIDIDDKIKTQEQLLDIVKKERELNELKSGFINMVSHEVRTPLAGILSSVELLEIYNQKLNQTQIQKSVIYFERIKDQILRISDLMNNVLLLGKIESGKIELTLKKVDLIELLSNYLDKNYSNKAIKLRIFGLQTNVKLDWKIISHVFSNLIDNAIKYSLTMRPPEVEVIFLKNKVDINIHDFGIGIPKKDIPKLFVPFNRASNVGNIEGTGLGLILTKNFIELHKGTIKLKSKINKGTTFTITLPF